MLTVEDFAGQIETLVELTREMAQIESPSTEKAAVDRMGTFLAGQLRELGAVVTIHEQAHTGNHVEARWDPAGQEQAGPGRQDERRQPAGTGSGEAPPVAGARPLLLLCHMDTVCEAGTLERRPVRRSDGRLYGPGVLDMKGGIAVLLGVARLLRERGTWPDRPIVALFTADEEIGSRTSRRLIEERARDAALALVLEPARGDGGLKTARKGTGTLKITTRGRSAHAGVDHPLGRNAIEELAHHVLTAQRLTDYETGTTVNVGKISGGTRTNVVPDEAHALADVRVASKDEVERLSSWTAGLRPILDGTQVEARVTFNRPPMPRDALMASTFGRAQAIAARLGMSLREGSTGGGSDGNFVAALGVPVLDGLGPQGDGAHAEHEHLLVSSLPERAALLAALLSEWQ